MGSYPSDHQQQQGETEIYLAMATAEKGVIPSNEGGQESCAELESQKPKTAIETASDKSHSSSHQPVRGLKPLSWFFVVFSLLAALFLFALDNTIVANVQENIIYTLGGIEKLPWISVAFALGAVATNLFWYDTKQA